MGEGMRDWEIERLKDWTCSFAQMGGWVKSGMMAVWARRNGQGASQAV